MKELVKRFQEGSKRIVPLATISAIAALGIASCNQETNDITWQFQVECPENEQPIIRDQFHRGNIGSFKVFCGDEAPDDVRLINESTIDTRAKQSVPHNLEVVAKDVTGWNSAEARVAGIREEDDHMVIGFSGVENYRVFNIKGQE